MLRVFRCCTAEGTKVLVAFGPQRDRWRATIQRERSCGGVSVLSVAEALAFAIVCLGVGGCAPRFARLHRSVRARPAP
eukprot:11171467-Lingulodinium_polyedra.AAC.1